MVIIAESLSAIIGDYRRLRFFTFWLSQKRYFLAATKPAAQNMAANAYRIA